MSPAPFALTGFEVCCLMRRSRVSIRTLAARIGVSLKRVREARRNGVKSHAACDYFEAITGSLRSDMAKYYRDRADWSRVFIQAELFG